MMLMLGVSQCCFFALHSACARSPILLTLRLGTPVRFCSHEPLAVLERQPFLCLIAHKQRFHLDEVGLIVTIVLHLGTEGRVEHLGRVEGASLLLPLDNLRVEHGKVALGRPAHSRLHLVYLHRGHLRRIADLHLDDVLGL